MDSFSTFTPKGIVYIPQKISKKVGFRSYDRIALQVVEDGVLLKRIPSLKEAAGMLKSDIHYTPEEEEKKLEEEMVKFYKKKFGKK